MTAPDHPNEVDRTARLDEAMRLHNHEPDALIEVLHRAQELFGHLDADVLAHVAHGLKLPPSRVQGVATFYHLFRLQPQGTHTCIVCTGTACFFKGAGHLLRTAEEAAGIEAGATTADGKLTLMTARCIDGCGIAPAVVFDGAAAGGQTPEALVRRLREWQ
jgi:bidirectional [NiFe] hydrogenase diaphorase subunit